MKKIIILTAVLLLFVSCQDGPEDNGNNAGDNENGTSVSGIELVCQDSFTVEKIYEIDVVVLFNDGTRSLISPDDAEWISENKNVARFESPGKLLACSSGECEIVVRHGGFLKKKRISVTDTHGICFIEILYDAEGSDTGKEFVVVANYSGSSVDLSGYRIIDGNTSSSEFIFPDGTVLENGEKISVCADADIFSSVYGIDADIAGMKFSLNNNGEALFLFSDENSIVDEVYIEGGTDDFPEPGNYAFPGLSSTEGNSLNYDFQHSEWFSAAPVNSYK